MKIEMNENVVIATLLICIFLSIVSCTFLTTRHYQRQAITFVEGGYEQVILPGSPEAHWQKAQ